MDFTLDGVKEVMARDLCPDTVRNAIPQLTVVMLIEHFRTSVLANFSLAYWEQNPVFEQMRECLQSFSFHNAKPTQGISPCRAIREWAIQSTNLVRVGILHEQCIKLGCETIASFESLIEAMLGNPEGLFKQNPDLLCAVALHVTCCKVTDTSGPIAEFNKVDTLLREIFLGDDATPLSANIAEDLELLETSWAEQWRAQ